MISEKQFYHIYPLGFCGAKEWNDKENDGSEKLLKIIEWIPHMKSMGINALYLGPIFESTEHGYDTVDYFQVDRRLGDNNTLKKLVKELHKNDISLVLDGVFNHVGREHFAFMNVKDKREGSEYKDWFNGLNFHGNNPFNDGFDYETWAGHYKLVKLNLKNHSVKQYLFDAVRYWIEEFDIDGIRLDAADSLDFNFMKELVEYSKSLKDNFWLMGEVVHGDYRRWLEDGKLDATTNYECFKGLYSSHNDKNYFEIAHSLKRLFGENGIYKNYKLYNFSDNHDVNRVGSLIKREEDLYNLYTILYTMPGVPSIYYGSEFGIEGKKECGGDRSLRPCLNLEELKNSSNMDLKKHIGNLGEIRGRFKSLKRGAYKELLVSPEQFAFTRKTDDEELIIILNSNSNKKEIKIDGISEGRYIDYLNNGEEIELGNDKIISLYSNWARILKKI